MTHKEFTEYVEKELDRLIHRAKTDLELNWDDAGALVLNICKDYLEPLP